MTPSFLVGSHLSTKGLLLKFASTVYSAGLDRSSSSSGAQTSLALEIGRSKNEVPRSILFSPLTKVTPSPQAGLLSEVSMSVRYRRMSSR